MDTHHTTKDLLPEELKEYRLQLGQHFQNRKEDGMLLQRAWHTVHQIAAMLYEDFDATQVAVFGSLAEPDAFAKWSDIDLAVWGIPSEKYFRAVWKAEEITKVWTIL